MKKLHPAEIIEKVTKLPKWARDYIRDITRERKVAVRALNEFIDEQTESPFSFYDGLCLGEQAGPTMKTKYVQTYQMDIKHSDVHLNVMIRDDCIELRWSGTKFGLEEVAFIPTSFQNAKLVGKEKMRQ